MKKLLLIGLAVVSLSLSANAAGRWVTQSFINGKWLAIGQSQTNSINDTDVFFVDGGNVGRFAMNTNYIIPTTGSGGTNFIPASGVPAIYWTNAAAYSSAYAQRGGANNGPVYNGSAIVDVNGFVDAHGNAPSSAVFNVYMPATNSASHSLKAFTSSAYGPAGQATNLTYFTLVKIPIDDMPSGAYNDGSNVPKFDFGTPPNLTKLLAGSDYIQLGITNNGGTGQWFTTNLPTSFMQGARKIRLIIGATAGNAALTNYYRDISITGWID